MVTANDKMNPEFDLEEDLGIASESDMDFEHRKPNKAKKKEEQVNTQKIVADSFKPFQKVRGYVATLDADGKRNFAGIVTISTLLLLTVIILLVSHQSHEVNTLTVREGAQSSAIVNELGDINSELGQLAKNPQNSQQFQQALIAMSTNIASLKQSIGTLAKESDVQQVSTQLTSMQTDVDNQMTNLQKAVITGGEAKQFVDPKVLPFKVMSVDVISQQLFVTVNYHHLVTPLAIGDSVAGWRLSAADYDSEVAEFKNIKSDKYVKISLKD